MCAGEVVTRHNAMYKDLGRIKRKRLAVCSSAKDKQGYMLSSDMVLQGLQACAATCTGCHSWLMTDPSVLFQILPALTPLCLYASLHIQNTVRR